jgi:hypothetical protein
MSPSAQNTPKNHQKQHDPSAKQFPPPKRRSHRAPVNPDVRILLKRLIDDHRDRLNRSTDGI